MHWIPKAKFFIDSEVDLLENEPSSVIRKKTKKEMNNWNCLWELFYRLRWPFRLLGTYNSASLFTLFMFSKYPMLANMDKSISSSLCFYSGASKSWSYSEHQSYYILTTASSLTAACSLSHQISVHVSFEVVDPPVQIHPVSVFHARFYMKSSWISSSLLGKLSKDFQIGQLEFQVTSGVLPVTPSEQRFEKIELD